MSPEIKRTTCKGKTHVVIGGGSAGALLCYQLLKQGDHVILIDPASDEQPDCSEPSNEDELLHYFHLHSKESTWTYQASCSPHTKRYILAPQRQLASRNMVYPAAIGIGGTSTINAMMHGVGHPAVFDDYWPETWNSKTIERYSREIDEILSPSTCISSGNMKKLMQSTPAGQSALVCNMLIDSCDHRQRISLRKALDLDQWREQGRLTLVQATATKIVIDEVKKQAVQVVHSQGSSSPENGGEIIICAGVFETPQILARSMAQSPVDQASPTRVIDDSVGVALPLQDHVLIPYILLGDWYSNWSVFTSAPGSHAFSVPRYPVNSVHGMVFLDKDGNICAGGKGDDKDEDEGEGEGEGDASTAPKCQLVFVDGQISPWLVDLLLPYFHHGQDVYSLYLRPVLAFLLKKISSWILFRWICGHIFGVLVCLVQPDSIGSLTLHQGAGENVSVSIGRRALFLTTLFLYK